MSELFYKCLLLLLLSSSALVAQDLPGIQNPKSDNEQQQYDQLNNFLASVKNAIENKEYKKALSKLDSTNSIDLKKIPLNERSLIHLYYHKAYLADSAILKTNHPEKIDIRVKSIEESEYHHHHYFLCLREMADIKLQEKITAVKEQSEREKEVESITQQINSQNLNLLRNLLILILSLIIISILFSLLFYRNTKNRLKIESGNLKLNQQLLRIQMNPHFIFNAISNIRSLITKKDNTKAIEYLDKFSELFQNILSNSSKKWVKLNNELSAINDYVYLQQLRFNHSFQFRKNIAINNNIKGVKIPPMLIQPFIENAIEHGIRAVEKGLIILTIEAQGNKMICTIEDNGIGIEKSFSLKTSKNKTSLSTQITKDRLKLFSEEYNQQFDLTIKDKGSDSNKNGTIIKLTIPFRAE